MPDIASRSLKWAYVLTILGAIVPMGLSSSGWVAATLGASAVPLAMLPFVGPLLILGLGAYRIWLVVRREGTLDSYETLGLSKALRVVGIVALYVGALIAVANILARPVMRAMIASPTESGVEFYVVGVYLGLLSGVGLLGVVLFEFSRLLAFEANARSSHDC